jgi:hypothetical protein
MSEHETPNSSNGLLSRLQPSDRERLGEALRRLMAHGSILGLEPAQTDLYHWCYQNRSWMDEMAALLDLKLHWEHAERTVQAVPQSAAFLLRLKLDATLVLLTLWYEFDTASRQTGCQRCHGQLSYLPASEVLLFQILEYYSPPLSFGIQRAVVSAG